jgi:hypothetical protein
VIECARTTGLRALGFLTEASRQERRASKYNSSWTPIIGIDKRVIASTPDLDVAGTSFVERQNLTMRMGCAGSRD